MPRAYSEEQLEKYNEKCIPYNGKMYNEYEASQIQRGIERKIRRWKRENIAMEAAGEDISESAAKIKEWQERQADFINQTGLKQQSVREQFVGYSRKQASKVTQEVKRQEKIKRANDDLQDLRERSIIRATGVLVKAPTVPEQLTPNEHATQRLIERNLTIDDAKEIVKSASVALKQRNGSQYTYYSDKGFVAIQTDGTISSVGELNDGGRKLIEVLRNNGIKDKK